jgi:hypothetical protein
MADLMGDALFGAVKADHARVGTSTLYTRTPDAVQRCEAAERIVDAVPTLAAEIKRRIGETVELAVRLSHAASERDALAARLAEVERERDDTAANALREVNKISDQRDAAEARLAAVRALHGPRRNAHRVTMTDGTAATYVYGCRCGVLDCPTLSALDAEVTGR